MYDGAVEGQIEAATIGHANIAAHPPLLIAEGEQQVDQPRLIIRVFLLHGGKVAVIRGAFVAPIYGGQWGMLSRRHRPSSLIKRAGASRQMVNNLFDAPAAVGGGLG